MSYILGILTIEIPTPAAYVIWAGGTCWLG